MNLRICDILACTLAWLVPAVAQTPALDERIDAARRSKSLRNAQWSITAIAVDTHSAIVSVHPDLSLAPASCLKLVTTAACRSLLGEEYRFNTRIYAEGPLGDDGVLKGAVTIVGGGDPTL